MKKRKFTLMLFIVLFSICLFSCTGSGVTAITPKHDIAYLSLNSSVFVENLVDVEGAGKLLVTVDDATVLGLNGTKITAKKEGESFVTVSGGSIECRFKIAVVNGAKISIGLTGGSYDYDGGVKTPAVSGNLPEGTEVEFYYNGELFTGATDPGVYEIELEVTPPDGFYVEYTAKKATLTINKKFLDLSYIDFLSASYAYDGSEKSIEIKGELPDGVTVSYINNRAVDAGDYEAQAVFSADERYYESIPTRYARLRITRRVFDVDFSQFVSQTVTYDGKTHIPTVSTPAGLNAELTVETSDGKYMPIEKYLALNAAAEPFKRAGVYNAMAVFTVDDEYAANYEPVPNTQITVTVQKAQLIDGTVWKTSGANDVGNFTYDGTPVTVARNNGAGRGLGLFGDLPTGVNGEFAGEIKVSFAVNGQSGETVSVSDAGFYTVTCIFTMPEDDGWKLNYTAPENKSYLLVVEKAAYPVGFSFDAVDENGVDYTEAKVYDGQTHYFKLKFSSAADEERFNSETVVNYYYETTDDKGEFSDEVGVKESGVYTVGCRLSFKSGEDYRLIRKNYTLPSELKFTVEITPKIFDMSGVKFVTEENGAKLDDMIYDGLAHGLEVVGVPDGVVVEYVGNGVTDAGEYTVKAEFKAVGILPTSYRLLADGRTVNSLNAKLTIRKAQYEDGDVPVYTAEGGEYSPDKTLSDYPILGENAEAVRWANPSAVPVCNKSAYAAVYNADGKNYNDYNFSVTLAITPVTFVSDGLEVKEQMIKYGSFSAPQVTYYGVATDCFKVSYNAENGVIGIGGNKLINISVQLVDNVNYRVDGEIGEFDDVTVYAYNGNVFTYDDLNLRLVRYKGIAVDVTVPDGTRSIGAEAFSGTATEKLYLPDSLVAMRIDSLAGMDALREIELPFTGTAKGGDEKFAAVFGGKGVPATLRKITVTDMTDIPPRVFEGLTFVEEITFSKKIATVGEGAFARSGILSADFSDAIEVGQLALTYCFALKDLKLAFLGENATDAKAISYLFGSSVGDNSYDDYTVETLDLSKSALSYIVDDAFRNLSSLKKIILPDSLKTIGKGAFYGVAAEVNLNGNLTAIGFKTFYGYKGKSLALPEGLERIEAQAFAEATELKTLAIPSSVRFIGENAFAGMFGTVSFAGSGVTRIEKAAFAEYKGVALKIPDSVTEIGDGAFENSAIEYIAVCAGTALGDGVFKGCVNLREAEINTEEIPFATFENCVKLERVSIPYINKISDRAFYGCVKLSDVALPSTLSTVGVRAFYGCSGLRFLTFASELPPTLGQNALPSTQLISVYVPEAAFAAYQNAFESEYANVTVSVKG